MAVIDPNIEPKRKIYVIKENITEFLELIRETLREILRKMLKNAEGLLPPALKKKTCHYCKNKISIDAKFCPYCGMKRII